MASNSGHGLQESLLSSSLRASHDGVLTTQPELGTSPSVPFEPRVRLRHGHMQTARRTVQHCLHLSRLQRQFALAAVMQHGA